MFFGAGISGNTSPMKGIFFFGKCLKINIDFKNVKKIPKKFILFRTIVPELVSLNYFY